MTHDAADDNHYTIYTTTDSSYHTAIEYDIGAYPGCVASFIARAVCRDTSTGDCAAFEQPFAAKCDNSTAGMIGSTLPSLTLLQKDLALILSGMQVAFSGTKVQLQVKGKASTQLEWMVSLDATLIYQP